MAEETHDILEDTFCLYCQEDHGTPRRLQNHVLKRHPTTYAAHFIQAAKETKANDGPPGFVWEVTP